MIEPLTPEIMESIKLSLVVQSYLSDLLEEHMIDVKMTRNHIRFVKLLTFYNPDLNVVVTTDYLDELWKYVSGNGVVTTSFEKFEIDKNSQ